MAEPASAEPACGCTSRAESKVDSRLRAALLGGFLLLAALLLWPTTQSLLSEWRNAEERTYTHGFLIAALCAWMLYRSHPQLRFIWLRPRFAGVAVSAVLSMLWLIALRSGIQIGHQLLLPMLALSAVYTAFGAAAARYCAFPVGYLYFAIPLWTHGNELLRSLTVLAQRLAVQVTGIQAYVTGDRVHVPGGTFEIADGCSGLHFFIVALALATLYGELHRDSIKVRCGLAVCAAVLAIFANWVRVFVIILAGYLTNMQHYLVRVDHYYFGWGVFAVAMFGFFYFAGRLPHNDVPRDISGGVADPVLGPAKPWMLGALCALSALGVGPLIERAAPPAAARDPASVMPAKVANWLGPADCAADWKPVYDQADRRRQSEYRSGEGTVCIYEATYFSQRQGKELVNYDNSLYDLRRTEVLASGKANIGGRTWNELRIADGQGRSALIWYYYTVGGVRTLTAVVAQLRYGVVSLASAPASSLIAIRSECVPDCDGARDAFIRFARDADLQPNITRGAASTMPEMR